MEVTERSYGVEQYTRKSTDLLAVQGEISQEIAENLRVRLIGGPTTTAR